MFETLKEFINSDNFIKLLTVLFTTFSAYLVAKYNLNNPRKLKVKQLQFDNVYLPIYKIIYKSIDSDISKEVALDYWERIDKVLNEHFEFAFPQLHLLNDEFLESIVSDTKYSIVFDQICYQVSLEYSLLTKSLGYPSENAFSLFRRMQFKDKFKVILTWFGIIYAIFFPLFILSLFDNHFLISFVIFLLGAYILIKLHDSIN